LLGLGTTTTPAVAAEDLFAGVLTSQVGEPIVTQPGS
jgi:hypothetical protein